MIEMTKTAINKVVSILESQDPPAYGLRVAVIGGGCSGFSYSMTLENEIKLLDKTYEFEGVGSDGKSKKLTIMVDQASLLYLDGVEVDFLETLEASGFKFNNPNVKSTCGCGSSFSA